MAWSSLRKGATSAGPFVTAILKRGDLTATIDTTGTVEPEEVMDVGAQVAGQIISFGKDKDGKQVDYGSVVEEVTMLAKIDDSLYAADLAQANAQLEQARANETSAEANVLQMQAKLDQASRDWDRAQKLGPSEALAPTTYDAYNAASSSNVGNSTHLRPRKTAPHLRVERSGSNRVVSSAR